MTRELILLSMLLTGCTSGTWWQAKVLSGADTKQAIALEESQDPKRCTWVQGSGSYLGVSGLVKHLEARGKGISFQDCLNGMTSVPGSLTLPSESP